MERISTITISKKRMALVIILCMIAGSRIGYYFGAEDQHRSDENYLINFAETQTPVQIRDHVFSLTEMPVSNITINSGRLFSWTNQ